MGRLQLWLFLYMGILSCSDAAVNIQLVGTSSDYEEGKVTVRCSSDEVGSYQLFRRLGSSIDSVEVSSQVLGTGFTFKLIRTNEGYYFCGGSTNSSEVELVAYPFSDSSIGRVHMSRIGSVLHMPCTIPFGVLTEKYSVRWFKGLDLIDTEGPRVTLTGSTLLFNTVTAEDNGYGYYCVVSVSSFAGNATRYGATISLVLQEPLQLESGIRSQSVEVGGHAEFSCSATGLPTPNVKWLVKGVQQSFDISTSSVVFRNTTIKATSTFSMFNVPESMSGQVTCLAVHANGGELYSVASTANLVVLTNDFEVRLIPQEGEVVLRGTLPYSIPGVFTLAVRFYQTDDDFVESNVFDPSLADTNTIDIKIPREKLPSSFHEFYVHVALKVGDRMGQFTSLPSNKITKIAVGNEGLSQPNTSGECDCPDSIPTSGFSTTIVVVVVVVLIVLVCVAILVLVVGCVFLYNKKVNLEKAYAISQHYSQGSLHRCASRTSCSSQGSRRSDNSYKSNPSSSLGCSRHDSSRSMNRVELELEVIQETGEVDSSSSKKYENVHKKRDGPRDVRDYETMDHRALKQREEHRANYLASLGQRGAGVPTTVRDAEHVLSKTRRPHEPEPVFPKTHIGAVNAVNYRPGGGYRKRQGTDSGSSFEDLEDDYNEMTLKSF